MATGRALTELGKTFFRLSTDVVTSVNALVMFSMLTILLPKETKELLAFSDEISKIMRYVIALIFDNIEIITNEANDKFGQKAVAYFIVSVFLAVMTTILAIVVQIINRSIWITVLSPWFTKSGRS